MNGYQYYSLLAWLVLIASLIANIQGHNLIGVFLSLYAVFCLCEALFSGRKNDE